MKSSGSTDLLTLRVYAGCMHLVHKVQPAFDFGRRICRTADRGAIMQIGFTSGPALANSVPVMDKFWSICAMPIGVALVMLPAAVAWWMVDRKKPHPDEVAKATAKKKA